MTYLNRGAIFDPSKHGLWWARTHGMLPVAEHLEGDWYRVYFSGRNEKNESHIGYLDLDILTGETKVNPEPILSRGELGTFDDCGVSPLYTLNFDGLQVLYYMGWHRDGTTRACETTGQAVFKDGKLIERNRAPIFSRREDQPFNLEVLTYVSRDELGHVEEFYCDECDRWETPDLPNYRVRGGRQGKPAGIDYAPGESRVSCLRVLGDRGWFCSAQGGGDYQLGYVEWEGEWVRKPIETDGEWCAYPFPIEHKGKTYVLASSREYGKHGFGMYEQREA